MSDLIRREDAITVLYRNTPFDAKGRALLDKCESEINDIPSADRPQGEWITEYNGNGWNDCWDYTCSNCGKKYERADVVLYKANFCPNCGADMRKGADDGSR